MGGPPITKTVRLPKVVLFPAFTCGAAFGGRAEPVGLRPKFWPFGYGVNLMQKSTGRVVLLIAGCALAAGCNSMMNDWLRVTNPGNFKEQKTLEIRTSLTFEDTPSGIAGASFPTREDLEYRAIEYPISPGDALALEIYELRQRGVPYQIQAAVNNTGYINLPVLGRLHAEGLTSLQLEDLIRATLIERQVLLRPEVTVNPLYLQKSTYSVFGIGASGATSAPLRAGTFPLRRPDIRVLEAINLVGGLNEAVIDVYVFRYDDYATQGLKPTLGPDGTPVLPEGAPIPPSEIEVGTPEDEPQAARPSEEDELIAAVLDEPDSDEAEEMTPAQVDISIEQPEAWIWRDGEFVPNPSAAPSSPQDRPTIDPGAALASRSPAFDWARIAGESSYRIIRIPAEQLRNGDPDFDIFVRAGDVIRIVSGEIGLYWVMGQVSRAGPFTFNNEPITVKAAIASAGGLGPDAWPTRCTVYRRVGAREQMIQVNLDRIFAGQDPDFYVKRGDIINVGTHPLSPWLQRLRALTLPSPISNLGYSFTYSRNFADIDSFGGRANPHNEPDRFPNLFP
jgi:protein involved in polysaccharide export with SLBB domain